MERYDLERFLTRYGYLPERTFAPLSDSAVQEALDQYKYFNAVTLDSVGGDVDALLRTERCGVRDDVRHSLGSGSWPHGCYGEGHEVRIKVDRSGMPSFLEPVFDQVLDLVKAAYLEIGMRLNFVTSGKVNIDFSFERLRGSTIGLAIVPRAPGCSDRIWCKYDPSYQPRNIVAQWAMLIAHELGHNMGLGHTRGGIMNPSILSGPPSWIDDPAEDTLRGWFGGHDTPAPEPEEEMTFAMIKAGDAFYMSGGDEPAELKIGGKTYRGKLRNITPN